MADIQLWQVVPQANDVKNDDGVIIGGQTAGTRYAPFTLIAEHILAGNVAPKFDPSKPNDAGGYAYYAKELVIHEGVLYRFLFNKTIGAWDSTLVEAVTLSDDVVVSNGSVDASVAPYNDLNTYPNNEVVLVTSGYQNVSHTPVSESFNVVTISNSKSSTAKFQILTTSTNKVFVRSSFGGTWGEWNESANKILPKGSVNSSVAPYNDLNTYPNNEVVLVNSYSSVSNRPANKPFTIATIASSSSSSAKFQILTTSDGVIFIRAAFGGSWYDWRNIDNTLQPKGSVEAYVAPYNDLNTYPNNEVVLVTSGYGAVGHVPSNEPFNVATISNAALSSAKFQILTTSTGKIFTRAAFGGTWYKWFNADISEQTIITKGGVDASSAPYNDLNTYPNNEVVLVTTGYEDVSHIPVVESFNVATISNTKSSTAKFQILTTQTKKVYIRAAFGSGGYGDWERLDRKNDGFLGNPLLGSFSNMLFLGDSLTASQVFYGPNLPQNRPAHTPYPISFAYLCKSTATILATSGYTAKQWWETYGAQIPTLTNALAVVYLGTNSGFTDTLAVDAPENTDPSTWDDTTNTGCYALIINKLITLGYKVLCVKPWVTGGDIDITKKVVGEAAARFGCCAVDAPVNRLFKYHAYPDGSGQNTVHYNDLGYAWFASALVDAVANAADEQVKYIIPE